MPESTQDTQKTERIASALYVITGFFTDREPIKWKLRDLASELVLISQSINGRERELVMMEIRATILKIIGLLSVAISSNLMSRDNYEIMNQEVTKYLDNLEPSSDIRNFLSAEHQSKTEVENTSQYMIKDKSIYETLLEKRQITKSLPKEKSLKDFGVVSVKKNTRQSIIINILKRKREIMIKDVTPLISGCSEKTIQRELSSMVRRGILKKYGEKRWSRYALA